MKQQTITKSTRLQILYNPTTDTHSPTLAHGPLILMNTYSHACTCRHRNAMLGCCTARAGQQVEYISFGFFVAFSRILGHGHTCAESGAFQGLCLCSIQERESEREREISSRDRWRTMRAERLYFRKPMKTMMARRKRDISSSHTVSANGATTTRECMVTHSASATNHQNACIIAVTLRARAQNTVTPSHTHTHTHTHTTTHTSHTHHTQ